MRRSPSPRSLGITAAPALLLALAAPPARAEAPVARATRRTTPIELDGRLDEAAWRDAPRQGDFVQRFPSFGAAPSQATRFAVLYDDRAVYVGIWADDTEPARIRSLLTRRDLDVTTDSVAVAIDSYFDRRTAYLFQLSTAGVQRDLLLFDDAEADDTWDAVWTGATARGAGGWTAELRIPLNQLRFAGADVQRWGLQVFRFLARTQEESTWSAWPRTGSEIVSKFGVLEGIERLQPRPRLELLPYVTGGVAMMPVDAADPLNAPRAARGNLGLDLKYGLGSAFTLSATINPDFGQVEADPSQVNLTANELFFAERRPFFLEGVDLFKLPLGDDGSAEGAFYSRRIGAAPAPPRGDHRYLRVPTSTTIYGAAKLTGKTRDGWSFGLLDAVTAEESAAIVDAEGAERAVVVAPLTNYAVARVKRDLRGGLTSLGASATAVHRALDGTGLEGALHDQAYTGGAQLQHRWDQNAWQLDLRLLGSFVHGSEEAIARTQRHQRHLLQRPDARTFHFDPTRTSLAGLGATWKLGRSGNTRHWRYMFAGTVRTYGLELNDLGFQTSSDRAIPYLWVQYHDETPGEHVLNYELAGDVFLIADELNGDPRIMDYGFECYGGVQLVNQWRLGFECYLARAIWLGGGLRGGPTLRVNSRPSGSVSLATDNRQRVWFSLDAQGSRDGTSDSINGGLTLGATIQARPNLDVFLGPSYSYRTEAMQYVEETADEAGRPHYVFARLAQTTAAMTLRVNWTFSPRLSLQAYAQPFVSNGLYSEYKDVTNAGAVRYTDRFDPLDRTLALGGGRYTATNGGTFSFARPDFDFRQLRSTAVLRWEYRPGSSVFAIWSHGRTSADALGRIDLARDLRGLAEVEGEHVVMVKANYWLGP